MTESGWLQLAGLIIPAITGVLVIWLKLEADKISRRTDAKFVGVKDQLDEHDRIDKKIKSDVSDVIAQNEQQLQKLGRVHDDINGRVAELVAIRVKEELRTVREQERAHAQELIDVAKAAALEIIEKAKKEAGKKE